VNLTASLLSHTYHPGGGDGAEAGGERAAAGGAEEQQITPSSQP